VTEQNTKSDVKQATTVEEISQDIESFDGDIEALKRRNIKLEPYTRREKIGIFNIEEETD
jgi:hypothetical protein